MIQHYRVRSTNATTGSSFTIVITRPVDAGYTIKDHCIQAQQAMHHDPLTSMLEHQLLGVGAPAIPARARLFHTMEQARSYMDGWDGMVRDTNSLTDFSQEGYLDRDKYDNDGHDGDRHGN